ncbi:MAG: ABC transporter substrate-binding protein [Actinomycetota bacterium]
MKRWLIAIVTFALVAAACTASGGSNTPSAIETGSGTTHAPLTIQIWGDWSGRELRQFNQIFKGFTQKYPWITVNSVGGVADPKILAAINSGTPPDVVLSFTLDNVGQFCASGAWQDLNPYIQQSGFDVSQFPPSVEAYTSFAGSRCTFPFLTDAYGLYYNTDLFKKAGISDPPKTLTELEADAKKLTVFNPDGSIKVAGFVPWQGYYENSAANWANIFGAKWYSADGKTSVVDSDPQWAAYFNWEHDFIANVYGGGDFQTGADVLNRFVAGAGSEFSAAQDFQTGRVAMNLDGEWRTAFIKDGAPDLPYATAPMPLPDDQADQYGRGQIGGTIIGIPKGSPHPAEAWLLVSWMATDTATLVYMANNVRNVPTTLISLSSPDLDVTPQFQTFLDIFKNPNSHYKEPSVIGASDQTVVGAFAADWQLGKQTDLMAGLQSAAKQINDQLAQAGP